MEILQVGSMRYVVKTVDERVAKFYDYVDKRWQIVRFPQPNFRGTGKALCGILKEGESLEEWLKAKYKRRIDANY